VAGAPGQLAVESVVIYLIIYAFMNLGAFAVVLAVARKTRSGDIASYGGLINYAPGMAGAMTVFLFALAGIPPLAGWFAKFAVFRAVIDAGTLAGYALGVVIAVNSVIALVYYANVAKEMWFNPVPDGDETPVPVTGSLGFAIGLTVLATVVFGIVPGVIGHFGEISVLASPL
jgi:NADH-quinone oxidoreductase subunit N